MMLEPSSLLSCIAKSRNIWNPTTCLLLLMLLQALPSPFPRLPPCLQCVCCCWSFFNYLPSHDFEHADRPQSSSCPVQSRPGRWNFVPGRHSRPSSTTPSCFRGCHRHIIRRDSRCHSFCPIIQSLSLMSDQLCQESPSLPLSLVFFHPMEDHALLITPHSCVALPPSINT